LQTRRALLNERNPADPHFHRLLNASPASSSGGGALHLLLRSAAAGCCVLGRQPWGGVALCRINVWAARYNFRARIYLAGKVERIRGTARTDYRRTRAMPTRWRQRSPCGANLAMPIHAFRQAETCWQETVGMELEERGPDNRHIAGRGHSGGLIGGGAAWYAGGHQNRGVEPEQAPTSHAAFQPGMSGGCAPRAASPRTPWPALPRSAKPDVSIAATPMSPEVCWSATTPSARRNQHSGPDCACPLQPGGAAAFAACSPAFTGHRRRTSCGAALRPPIQAVDFEG